MSDKLVDLIDNVAVAIKDKNNEAPDQFTLKQMPDLINAIETGITPTGTLEINIESNGASDHDVTNYANAHVTVNVPERVITGEKEINIVENGTKVEDVTEYATAKINVNVPREEIPVPTPVPVNYEGFQIPLAIGGSKNNLELNLIGGKTDFTKIPKNSVITYNGYYDLGGGNLDNETGRINKINGVIYNESGEIETTKVLWEFMPISGNKLNDYSWYELSNIANGMRGGDTSKIAEFSEYIGQYKTYTKDDKKYYFNLVDVMHNKNNGEVLTFCITINGPLCLRDEQNNNYNYAFYRPRPSLPSEDPETLVISGSPLSKQKYNNLNGVIGIFDECSTNAKNILENSGVYQYVVDTRKTSCAYYNINKQDLSANLTTINVKTFLPSPKEVNASAWEVAESYYKYENDTPYHLFTNKSLFNPENGTTSATHVMVTRLANYTTEDVQFFAASNSSITLLMNRPTGFYLASPQFFNI